MEPTEPTPQSPSTPAAGVLAAAQERARAMLAFDRREIVALALLAVLVVTGATVAYARARPTDAAALAPTTQSTATSPQAADPSIAVHIVGAVQRPGVYEFPEGARVIDAVDAAGGFARKADRSAVNLARALVDGEQIVVPRIGEAPQQTSAGGASAGVDAGGRLNINTATAADLEALPGIGPVLAQRIVDHREQHGPFRSVADLQKVSGIGAKTFASLEPLITV